ncbi:hypothetical protein [Rhodovibrio sodomensis]|uniref:hypothetical protein n=1 Tax=Rhodovibrio sodomensis TaxID=1088 RepID=UPI0019053320|nr:hypothetical protein [Rhodovibrio sodomensis]
MHTSSQSHRMKPARHVLAERYGSQLARRMLEAAARDAGLAEPRPLQDDDHLAADALA